MIKFKQILLFVTFLFIGIQIGFAQNPLKNTDLSLRILSPLNNEVFNPGDTTEIVISIKNNGPEDLTINDTIFYHVVDGFALNIDWFDLPVNDSVILTPIFDLYNSNSADETVSLCLEILDISNDFNDTDSSNNKSCVTFIMKGREETSIKDSRNHISKTLKFYPNPASTEIILELKRSRTSQVVVRIMDVLGKVVLQSDYSNLNESSMKIDISTLQSGLYLLELNEDGYKSGKKLLIQK